MVSGRVLNAFLSKSLCVIRESTGLAKPGALVPLLFPILFSILFYSETQLPTTETVPVDQYHRVMELKLCKCDLVLHSEASEL